MQHVLDYSWGRPDPARIAKLHYPGILRYLCDTPGKPGKALTSDELGAALTAGLQVACIWQETKDAMLGGRDAGFRDGQRAQAAAQALGVPEGAGIYFAADSEKVTPELAASYLVGVRQSMSGYRTGLYGGYDVITGAAEHADLLWQTPSWSAGRIAEGICLYQACHGLSLDGAPVDVNDVYAPDWGQFASRADS